jgi:hypothetical protein
MLSATAEIAEISPTMSELPPGTKQEKIGPMLDLNVFKLFENLMDEKQKVDIQDAA